MSLARLVAAAVAALTLLVPASAQASPNWLRAQTISRLGSAPDTPPEVALLPSGDGVAAWGRPSAEGIGYSSIVAAIRPRGARFSAAQQLSQGGRRVGSFDLAGSSAGETIAVWSDLAGLPGEDGRVQASVRRQSGAFGPPLMLASTAASDARVATGPGGIATVAWARNGRIQVADRPAGGGFGPVRTISQAGRRAARPAIAIGASGETVLVWAEENCTGSVPRCGAYMDMMASARPADGSFSAPQTFRRAAGSQFTVGSIELATGAGGAAAALWNEFLKGGLYSGGSVHSATRAPAAGFGQARSMAAGGASGLALLADGAGRTTGLWGSGEEALPGGDGNPRGVFGASRLGRADFGRVRRAERGARYPALTAAAGRLVGVWSRGVRVRAAVRRRRGGYCTVPISSSSRRIGIGGVAGDARGNTLAVWGDGSRVKASVGRRGRARPRIRRFSVGPKRFRTRRRRTPRIAATPRGTAFRFNLSEAAQVRITVVRRRRGRLRRVLSFSTGANAGRHTVRFTGRVGNTRLGPGRYRARIRAKDCDGRSSSRRRPRAVRFRVVR